MRSFLLAAFGAAVVLAGVATVPAGASPMAPVGAATATTGLADTVAGNYTEARWYFRRRFFRPYRYSYRPHRRYRYY